MVILEYIWLDSNNEFRTKIKVMDKKIKSLEEIPKWNFDGSSTGQADIENSEVELIPIKVYHNKFNEIYPLLVLCDTRNKNNDKSEYRKAVEIFNKYSDEEPMYGLEQEFFILDVNNKIPEASLKLDGKYYCGIGLQNHKSRPFLLEVLYTCIDLGIKLTGMNYEVAPGQAEFQVCNIGIDACNDLIMLRFLLCRYSEKFNIKINFDPKPFKDQNGSGCHLNFSTKSMRNENDRSKVLKTITKMCKKLEEKHELFINEYYGSGNKQRLTGTNETSSYETFSVKKASRSVSVRVPTEGNYFEDRRPSSNINPYLACSKFLECVMN